MLDVRERDAFEAATFRSALLPRGQLELRVNEELTDPTRRILVYCEFGRISTLATATLRQMGFRGAVALDGGMKAWREAAIRCRPAKNDSDERCCDSEERAAARRPSLILFRVDFDQAVQGLPAFQQGCRRRRTR